MNKEKQVISLELARKLKKLGVKQESLWHWSRIATGDGKKGQITKAKLLPDWEIQPELTEKDGVYRYSAFTVAELGEMLPEQAYSEKIKGFWFCRDKWRKYKYGGSKSRSQSIKDGKTEANTRAKMLIYLLENGLLKL